MDIETLEALEERELMEGYKKLGRDSRLMVKTILNTAVLAQEAALHGSMARRGPEYADRRPAPVGAALTGEALHG
jgi:hypothetical protein